MHPPDVTEEVWHKWLYDAWLKVHAVDIEQLECVAKLAKACQEINDSGEQYTHQNADGAQAFANLCSAVQDLKQDAPIEP